VRHFNIKTMIAMLVDRLDRQRRDVQAAKFEKHADKVRAILTLLG